MKNTNLRYVKKSDKYYQKIELINGKEKKTRISKKEYKQRGGDYKLMKGNKKNITINQTHKSWQMIDDALNSATNNCQNIGAFTNPFLES